MPRAQLARYRGWRVSGSASGVTSSLEQPVWKYEPGLWQTSHHQGTLVTPWLRQDTNHLRTPSRLEHAAPFGHADRARREGPPLGDISDRAGHGRPVLFCQPSSVPIEDPSWDTRRSPGRTHSMAATGVRSADVGADQSEMGCAQPGRSTRQNGCPAGSANTPSPSSLVAPRPST